MTKFYRDAMIKVFRSEDFNYNFRKDTGYTEMWGKTIDDNPDVAPFPVILDFEITERCEGIGNYGPCKFCYKSNVPNKGYVTSFAEAKAVIDKLPRECTQIAFGTDAKLKSNPEWYEIFRYARDSGFIPNVTVADLTKETAEKVSFVVGACAVSRYQDKDICYDTIKLLSDAGLKQVNMHCMISAETMPMVLETLDDIKTDPRLKGLNAIVFLSLKRKGRGESYHCISQKMFSDLVNRCISEHIRFGFDSCSANKFLNTIRNTEYSFMETFCEPCESSCMSFYVNARGEAFPCSFTEGTEGWETGLDVKSCNNFIDDIWQNPRVQKFRETLLKNHRNCPIYHV